MARPDDIQPGDPIMASWLNRAKNAPPREIRGGVGINVLRVGQDLIIESIRQPRSVGTANQRFLAQITATDAMGSSDSRWVYTIEEVTLSITASSGVPSAVSTTTLSGGRTGKAINLAEIRNGLSIAFGISRGGDDYPGGFAPRPITGAGTTNAHMNNQVVEILGAAIASDGSVVYYFDRQGQHDGDCSA